MIRHRNSSKYTKHYLWAATKESVRFYGMHLAVAYSPFMLLLWANCCAYLARTYIH